MRFSFPAERFRRAALPLTLACLAVAFAAGAQDTWGQSAATPPVQLTIDFGDGSQLRFTQIGWRADMTAFDALAAAAKHPRGVEYKARGSGATAFVSEIDGQRNEGAADRNWLFKLNGKFATRGAGAQTVEAGDHVEWLFGKYEAER